MGIRLPIEIIHKILMMCDYATLMNFIQTSKYNYNNCILNKNEFEKKYITFIQSNFKIKQTNKYYYSVYNVYRKDLIYCNDCSLIISRFNIDKHLNKCLKNNILKLCKHNLPSLYNLCSCHIRSIIQCCLCNNNFSNNKFLSHYKQCCKEIDYIKECNFLNYLVCTYSCFGKSTGKIKKNINCKCGSIIKKGDIKFHLVKNCFSKCENCFAENIWKGSECCDCHYKESNSYGSDLSFNDSCDSDDFY